MLFRVFMLLSLYAASAHGQGFVCGYEPSGDEVSGASSHAGNYRSSTAADPIKVLILFGKFPGETHSSGNPLENAILLDTYTFTGRDNTTTNTKLKSAALVDPTIEGSLAHYFKEMSYENLHLASANVEAQKRWYDGSANPNLPTNCTRNAWWNAVSNFTRDVLANADADVNFADADVVAVLTPPRMGAPNDADGECNYNGTVLESPRFSWTSNDVDSAGTPVVVDKVITSDRSHRFPFIVGVLAHEYGHVMELPELFDRTNQTSPNDHAGHSAGIGYWGVMGRGADGYGGADTGISDGPAPMTAWSRAEVGWLDSRVETMSSDQDVTIPVINSSTGNVVAKIPVPGSPPPPMEEYFLLSNRQTGTAGSYYDDYAPASGLLIWHVDESVRPGILDANDDEEHKRVDVECADGLFIGAIANTVTGRDDLDNWSTASSHTGNLGDAADMWTSGAFTPSSNPSTHGYSGSGSSAQQRVFTGIAVRDITQNTTDGSVSVKIRFIPLAPTNFRATLSTTVRHQVDLSWSAPTPNGAAITGYEYSDGSLDSDGNESWTQITDEDGNLLPTASSVTIPSLTGREYTFKVRAFTDNEKGQASASASVDLLSQTIEGAAKPSVAEVPDPNATGPVDVGVYTYTAPNPNQPVWSLTGADADYFNLVQTSSNDSNERTLQFKEPPNYEVPLADGGYKTTYNIGVKVEDESSSGAAGTSGDALEDILLVTVTVTNVEEAGSVTLSPLPPKVGVALVAQLTDPDEGLTFTGASWAWERRADDTAAWESVSTGAAGATENYSELSSYTPQAADVGYHLRARVDYTDNEGPNKRAESEATAAVVDVPPAPALEAVAGDGQVALTWTAPSSDGGSPILRYQVRYLEAVLRPGVTQVVTGWKVVPGGAAARDTTIGGLTNGTAYIFRVLAENGVGSGARAEVTVTPEAPSCPITGPPKPTVAENTATTEAVATYTVSGDDCGSASWLALGGTDKSAFALQGSGTSRTLHFVTAPDYEAKRSYQVTVRLQVGSEEVLLPVKVLVSNVDEAGTVSMPSTVPRVGQSITATLTDLDGQVTGASWTWEREEGATWVTVWPSGAAGTAAESYPELSRYKPQTADIGHRLRARVSYRDPSSTDATDRRSAQSDPTASVVDVPSAPALTATAGDGQVALT